MVENQGGGFDPVEVDPFGVFCGLDPLDESLGSEIPALARAAEQLRGLVQVLFGDNVSTDREGVIWSLATPQPGLTSEPWERVRRFVPIRWVWAGPPPPGKKTPGRPRKHSSLAQHPEWILPLDVEKERGKPAGGEIKVGQPVFPPSFVPDLGLGLSHLCEASVSIRDGDWRRAAELSTEVVEIAGWLNYQWRVYKAAAREFADVVTLRKKNAGRGRRKVPSVKNDKIRALWRENSDWHSLPAAVVAVKMLATDEGYRIGLTEKTIALRIKSLKLGN